MPADSRDGCSFFCILANYGCNGCNGGNVFGAYSYIKDAGGDDTEASYPYHARSETCKFSRRSVGATVKGYAILREGDEKNLKKAVTAVGPVSHPENLSLNVSYVTDKYCALFLDCSCN